MAVGFIEGPTIVGSKRHRRAGMPNLELQVRPSVGLAQDLSHNLIPTPGFSGTF
jgi:hypothetical protein